MTDVDSSVRKHWQAHLSQDSHGDWVGWASHGEGDHPQTGSTLIATDPDVWRVVDAVNERMDGRSHRGYNPHDPENVAWIGEELVSELASQGINIQPPPSVGPQLSDMTIEPEALDFDLSGHERPLGM